MTDAKSPDDSITVNGQEIFMSFGLLNRLDSLIGGPDQIPNITVNAALRMAVMENLFSKYDSKGQITQEADLENMHLNPADTTRLLRWVGAHLFHFFIQGLQGMDQLATQFQTQAANLTLTQTGSGT